MPELSLDDWSDIKDAYETGGRSISDLSRTFGVSRTSIQRHIKSQGWVVTGMTAAEAEEAVAERAHAKAMGVDLNADEATQVGQIERAADDRQVLITRHRRAWDAAVPLHERLKKAFDAGWSPPDIPLAEFDESSRLKYASAIVGIYQKTVQSILVHQEGERRAHGFDYRIQQKSAEFSAETATRRKELMAQLYEMMDRAAKDKRLIEDLRTGRAVVIDGEVVGATGAGLREDGSTSME
jgi:hypothetical protein